MTVYVNESSARTVRAQFLNESNDPVSPGSIRYLIRDISNDRIVRDWTSVLPAASVDIQITAQDNDIYARTPPNRRFEKRVVTVQADPGEPVQQSSEIEYWVRNLAGIVND